MFKHFFGRKHNFPFAELVWKRKWAEKGKYIDMYVILIFIESYVKRTFVRRVSLSMIDLCLVGNKVSEQIVGNLALPLSSSILFSVSLLLNSKCTVTELK